MKTIEDRARLAAWQIFEEIGLSRHSVDRVAEIIAEKMREQKAIDDAEYVNKVLMGKGSSINCYKQGYHDAIDKVCEWLKENLQCGVYPCSAHGFVDMFRKAMEK